MINNKRTILGLAIAVWASVAATTLTTTEGHVRNKVSNQSSSSLLRTESLTGMTPRLAISQASDSTKTDAETGLALDEHLMLVKAQCTACHSSKLILQSHFSREKWIERIRWMQRTQKLWDLGDSEPTILNYLVKYYGPLDQKFDGRREPLKPVKWYPLSPSR
ncbi:hypothetical protein GCM10027341_54290 [Spirosoma knui]